jgi:hypothetical protein
MRLVIRGGVSTRKTDPTLLKAVARGHKWLSELVSGRAAFTQEIAERERVNERFVRRLVPPCVSFTCDCPGPSVLPRVFHQAWLSYEGCRLREVEILPQRFACVTMPREKAQLPFRMRAKEETAQLLWRAAS